jgi:hypothetical protein
MLERIIHGARRAFLTVAGSALLAGLVAGCGGSGAGAQGGSPTGVAGKDALSVQLLGSTATINSDGKTPIDLTAIVTDASKVAAKNVPVTFSAEDPNGASGGVRLEVVNGTTDATGAATARLSLLGDPSNRTIKVVATASGTASVPLEIQVTGTTLAVTGPSALALNSPASTFTVSLKDSAGKPLSGRDVTVSSAKGNALSATSIRTDSGGQASVGVRGTVPDQDTLTFRALGVTQEKGITVSGQGLQVAPGGGFTTASGAPAVALGTNGTVVVTYQSSSAIPSGATVNVSTTKGTITPASASIASGSASFQVASTFAGPATVTADVGGVRTTFDFNFVSVTPTQVDLQASPATVGPNLGGSTEQRATLTAVVRDAAGNPVADRVVSFTAIDDPSGGQISPGVATTDLAGRATTSFVAGPNTTAPNAVRVQATVGSIRSQVALLSVARSQLFVRLGTDNKIEKIEPALYKKTYAVVVTDSTGNAVNGATVQASLRPLQYATGQWVRTGATPPWAQDIDATFPSEDIDRNGVCSVGEDANGDGQLTPGNVATVVQSGVTNADGVTGIALQYPREFARWVEVVLEVRIQVAGSEGVASAQFFLPISADDVTDANVPPPGATSPFPFPTGPAIARSCPTP